MSFSRGHALCVGVAAYPHVRPLPAAVTNDARDVGALLTNTAYCAYPAGQVRVLLDAQATKAAMVAELERLAQVTSTDDTVLIFFSGHGATDEKGNGFLVPFDASPNDIAGTCLSGEALSQFIGQIPAARIVTVLDACHSGGTGEPKTSGWGGVTLKLASQEYERLAQGAGRVVMASSRQDEYSWALGGMRNSVFTDAVLRALRGAAAIRNDGLVRVFDVFHFVSQEVTQKRPDQHPIFKGTAIEQNFPLALFRGGTKGLSAALSHPSGDPWWSEIEALAAELYPLGPMDNELWSRAGGDSSQLRTSQTGRASWHAALRTLRQGGGGAAISLESLLAVMLLDFPTNIRLMNLQFQIVEVPT